MSSRGEQPTGSTASHSQANPACRTAKVGRSSPNVTLGTYSHYMPGQQASAVQSVARVRIELTTPRFSVFNFPAQKHFLRLQSSLCVPPIPSWG